MALGGYLYKGFSVEKDSGWTYTQWALAIHKLRVHAFLESCARSGAAWSVSRTAGEIDLDSAHTGVIYTLASDETNGTAASVGYATYFKYQESGDSSPRGYYLILTMPRWQCVESPSATGSDDAVNVYIGNMLSNGYESGGSILVYPKFMNSSCFYAISLDDFGTHPKDNGYIPSKSTRLTPCGANLYYSQSSVSSEDTTRVSDCNVTSDNYTFIGQNTLSFGYATKQGCSDIIEFEKTGNDTNVHWTVNVSSLEMISQNLNAGDNFKLASVKAKAANESYRDSNYNYNGEYKYQNYLGLRGPGITFLRDDGTLPWGYLCQYGNSYAPVYAGINCLPKSTLNSNRLYSSFILGTTNPGTMEVDSKGFVNVELLAFSYQSASSFSTTSGGKYLCIGSTYTSDIKQPIMYGDNITLYAFVGWDDSNPGMDTTLACPVYTPSIS